MKALKNIFGLLLFVTIISSVLEGPFVMLGVFDLDTELIEFPLTDEKEESRESEKQEKKIKAFDFTYSACLIIAATESTYLGLINFYRSRVDEVPSPPPDFMC